MDGGWNSIGSGNLMNDIMNYPPVAECYLTCKEIESYESMPSRFASEEEDWVEALMNGYSERS